MGRRSTGWRRSPTRNTVNRSGEVSSGRRACTGNWSAARRRRFARRTMGAVERTDIGGIPLLGSTFDPLDYMVYGAGALTAVVVDTQLRAQMFAWWRPAKAES